MPWVARQKRPPSKTRGLPNGLVFAGTCTIAHVGLGKPMAKRNADKAMLDYLDSKFGKDSKALIDKLAEIASGDLTAVEQTLDRNGVAKLETIGPAWSDRIAALKILLEYQQGKPEKTVNHNVTTAVRKWDPDKLTLQELEQLSKTLSKAEVKELDAGEIVDGELTEVDEGDIEE